MTTQIRTRQIADSAITLAKLAAAVTLDAINAPTASVDLNSQKIVGLAAATSAGDAIRFEQIGDLGFKDTIDNSALLEDEVVTESKLSTAVQTKLNAASAQNKLDATVAPAVTNDTTEGYSVNSVWLDVSNEEVYRCLDATEDAAVWVKTSLTIDELGTLATKSTIDSSSLLDNAVVTYAKIQNISAQYKLLGRVSTGAGVVEEITTSSFGLSLIDDADAATARTTLGLVIGTNVQAFDAELAAIAGLTSAANKIPMFSGSGTASLIDFKDEDDMVSDSATAVPSQQSVKAYVETSISAISIDSFADEEDLSGDLDGLTVAFVLAETPVSGSVKLYLNGQRLQSGIGKDYTITGSAITLATAPSTGEVLLADYRY